MHATFWGVWDNKSGPVGNQVLTKNERVFEPIADGKVEANLSGIAQFTEYGVKFNDGHNVEIDTIIFCTGYTLSFPFLDVQINNMRDLFK